MESAHSSIINFLGDIYLPKKYHCDFEITNFVVNMEYPITESNNTFPGKVNLKANNNYIKDTFGQSPLAVCLANNHVMDFCHEGLNDTLKKLSDDNINYYGAGYYKNHNNILIINHNNYKLAFLGYVCDSTSPPTMNSEIQCGVQSIELEIINSDINFAKEQNANRIFVSFHWGAEEIAAPKPDDVKIARSVIKMGADMVIGHHSHCIQHYEIYKGKYIFYGLGNCIFPDLNLPAFYDEKTKKTTRIFNKKQRWWNKQSLVASFNLLNGNITISKLYFDGKVLRKIRVLNQNKSTSIDLNKNYDKKFYRSFIQGKLRYAIGRYLNNPQFPNKSHLKTIRKLITTKVFK